MRAGEACALMHACSKPHRDWFRASNSADCFLFCLLACGDVELRFGWLTLQVTKVDLQRVRNVKAIMNKLMGRVGRIKQVLPGLLKP